MSQDANRQYVEILFPNVFHRIARNKEKSHWRSELYPGLDSQDHPAKLLSSESLQRFSARRIKHFLENWRLLQSSRRCRGSALTIWRGTGRYFNCSDVLGLSWDVGALGVNAAHY
jgi:hypothetical protein